MSIISQKYQNEFKNYIKDKILQIVDNISSNLFDNIFNYSNNKYLKFVSDLQSDIKDLIISIIKEAISFFDEKFRNSAERKKSYYINIREDDRTYITIWGEISFSRTYYVSKDGQTYFYFIDELLEIDKYKRYDSVYKSYAIDTATKTNQKLATEIVSNNLSTLEDILNNKVQYSIIPRQTTYNWIKEWKVPMIKYPSIDFEGDTLYVMADEKWIHEQLHIENTNDKNFIMSKCFVCFTGIEQSGSRRILKNRMVFITSSDHPWKGFLDFVTQIYDFQKLNYITFLSDGGKWLQAGAPDLKMYPHNKVTLCLCEFHAKQNVNRITTVEEVREYLTDCINNNKKKEFQEKMIEIKEEKKDNEQRLKKLVKYENYIINNWNKIQNMFKSECRSSMESHISHCVASYFSSRPKAYSRTNIEKHLKLQEAKINGVNIQNLYLQTYKNEEVITIEKEELNLSIFDKNNSSNIEIINIGKQSPLYSTLSGLSHGY